MAKIHYIYDTESCKYVRDERSTSDIILNTMMFLSVTIAMSVGLILVYSNYFESPKELLLKNDVQELEFEIAELQLRINTLNTVLENLTYRDDRVYRVVLGAEPIDQSIREAGVGGVARYDDIRKKQFSHKEAIIKLSESIDKLRRKVYIESKSHDEVVQLAVSKEKLFAAIPAIQPISKNKYTLTSGFGNRFDPITHIFGPHPGIDFAAPSGTPIYATADGVVDVTEIAFTGYGKKVEIDHGYGYRTRYAHMNAFVVKVGQQVKRGELIGYVGSTGHSTAPHVHYEVFINRAQVNPIYYFFNDLNPTEYAKIIELASVENQSMGM